MQALTSLSWTRLRRYWQRPVWMKKRCGEEQLVGQLEQDWGKAVIDADDNEHLLALSWREIVRLDARRRFLDYI
jgi:hypothetical protein